ncbi:MAG TPA: hypothetical protein VNG35_16540 [Gemmatimonadales bacterium]|nr:hypothetical protein [Gemmatimonadales bacterium]
MKRALPSQIKYICGPTGGVSGGQSFSGNAAALMAGRRLADPRAVDHAVCFEAARYLSLKRRTKADRERMRAALVPYIQAAQS